MITKILNRTTLILGFLLSISAEGQNLIIGGNFSQNTSTFSTDLYHIPSCTAGPGTYCITDIGWHPNQATPSDYMMKVDGNLGSTANDIIWSQTIHNVDSGRYEFLFQCFPRSLEHHIEVNVLINGHKIGSLLHNSGGWKDFTATYWIQQPMASLNITIKQVHFGHFTDWDLDNLSFFKSGSMVLDTITSIEDTAISLSFRIPPPEINVFPNPLVENLTLQVDSTFFPYSFAIHDFSGQLVYLQEGIKEKEHHLNLNHLPRAPFFARIISKGKIVWKGKLIHY